MSESRGTWPEVEGQPDLPRIEEAVLAAWRDHDVFAQTLRRREGAPVWTFYEGPPTANGLPGTHHVEARAFKDIFPRYRTMKGNLVPRKGGWDCHGLPVELEVEKELGLSSKAEIEEYGIEEFNARCRESVLRYVDAWEDLTERIGFWIDTEDPYRTMDASYVDSLWWALKELWERDLIFEEFRVAPYCGRCGTALSDAEVAQGYDEIDDPSVYVRFPLRDPLPTTLVGEDLLDGRDVSLAVWTTTPWTLPSNTATAVGPDIAYVLVESFGTAPDGSDELLVMAASLIDEVLGVNDEEHTRHRVLVELAAEDLLGLRYTAPFRLVEVDAEDRYLVASDHVTTADGTGLVHLAPAFGGDDLAICRREGLPVVNPVDGEGRFTTGPWAGQFVKDADGQITEALRETGHLIDARTYTHTYPFCWRCKRPLIYWAKPSWYIRTTARRDQLLANNAKIDWHPEHIRDGRFGNWLENNVDWALSRDRYWGTPLPFWRCGDCGHVTVVGSRVELGRLAGRDLTDLDPHRPYVDEVMVPCGSCGATAHRVADVADAWFDSGGMPYAQWGYPHRGQDDEFQRHDPADFICEAIDQTRGWFYTLLAESTLLFDEPSYRTVLCLGHIVDEHGRKMSKSLGNILDPWELIARHGADPLRWLMFAEGNPWVSRRVGHHLLDDVVRRFLLTLWNTHVFFTTYARIDDFALDEEPPPVADRPASDRWVLAELAGLIDTVDAGLARYDVSSATRALEQFVDDLSNWYVRRNRRRFWRSVAEDSADKAAAYHTLHTCLRALTGLLAPFVPFVADRLWQDLVVSQDPAAPISVHLTDFPRAREEWRDDELRAAMVTTRRVVELGRQARNDAAVRVRQPLARALVSVPAPERDGLATLLDDIAEELNIKQIELSDGTGQLVERTLKPNFRALGPAFQQRAPRVADALRSLAPHEADRVVADLEGGTARVRVDDEEVELTADMVETVERPRTGWAVASTGSTSFALDTELSRPLEVEGAARELIRAVNDQRKAAGLALDDRIGLRLDVTPDGLDEELEQAGWYKALAREVLADRLERTTLEQGATVELGGLGRATVELRP